MKSRNYEAHPVAVLLLPALTNVLPAGVKLSFNDSSADKCYLQMGLD